MSKADLIKEHTTGSKLTINWLGTSRAVEDKHMVRAASEFGADASYLSGRKKLFNTKHPLWKAMVRIRGSAREFWWNNTLPYTEPGVRLVRKDGVNLMDSTIKAKDEELYEAVRKFELEGYLEVRQEAKSSLGDLHNYEDYPETLLPLFKINHEFTSIEPPFTLKDIAPDIYEQELSKAKARCEQAANLAEQTFAEELRTLVTHLAERLNTKDGEKKVFHASSVENLSSFFDRFRKLKVTDNTQLDDLILEAESLLNGVTVIDLRNDQAIKDQVKAGFTVIGEKLDGMIIKKPRRKLMVEDAPQTNV